MVRAGRSAQQGHWKDNTLRKQGTLSHSANRIWSTAPPNLEITAAKGDSWTTPSGKRKTFFTVQELPCTKFLA